MNRRTCWWIFRNVSDKTFYDALEVSKAPLIASHSSCRALCNHPRDMTDDMIKALAVKGGVIQINYEKSFIDEAYRAASEKVSVVLWRCLTNSRRNVERIKSVLVAR